MTATVLGLLCALMEPQRAPAPPPFVAPAEVPIDEPAEASFDEKRARAIDAVLDWKQPGDRCTRVWSN